MNSYTVSRITEGVANNLSKNLEKPSVLTAYDTGQYSKDFALIVASVFDENGVRTVLFFVPVPTPLLFYAGWNPDCCAGIVITTSYSSKEYNG